MLPCNDGCARVGLYVRECMCTCMLPFVCAPGNSELRRHGHSVGTQPLVQVRHIVNAQSSCSVYKAKKRAGSGLRLAPLNLCLLHPLGPSPPYTVTRRL